MAARPAREQLLLLRVAVDEGFEEIAAGPAPRLEHWLARPQVQVAIQLRVGGTAAAQAAPLALRLQVAPVLGRRRQQVDVDGDVPRQRRQDVQMVLRQGGQAEHGHPLRAGGDGRPRPPLQPGDEPLLQPQVVAAAEPRRQRAPHQRLPRLVRIALQAAPAPLPCADIVGPEHEVLVEGVGDPARQLIQAQLAVAGVARQRGGLRAISQRGVGAEQVGHRPGQIVPVKRVGIARIRHQRAQHVGHQPVGKDEPGEGADATGAGQPQ